MRFKSLLTAALLLGSSPAFAAPLNAVASFSILGDMVAKVGGDRVTVTTIVGPDSDTHVYEPKPSDAVALKASQVFFVNGLGFEGWQDRLVEATGFTGPIVIATDGIKTHDMSEEAEDGHGEGHEGHDEAGHEGHGEAGHDEAGHHHDGLDPHAWQSLANGLIYVANIKAGLCKVDPDGCPTYTANAEAYSAEISSLDAWVKSEIAKVPVENRKVITSHDAFGYFAEEYGVAFLAPEGVSTESEASAADVARLIEQIRSSQAKALFIENMSDPRLVEQIARETGVKVGGALYSDALSAPGEPGADYLSMFRHNVGLLVPAMLGE